MAYSRFFDSDIYIYPHVDGYIECCGCWLKLGGYTPNLVMSEKIINDNQLKDHLDKHIQKGHNIPNGLLEEILADSERYG